jgi:hypothetical protein
MPLSKRRGRTAVTGSATRPASPHCGGYLIIAALLLFIKAMQLGNGGTNDVREVRIS